MTIDYKTLKAAYFTLGCKLNYAETSTIGKILSEHGILRVAKGEIPDICVVNTCSVTEMADKKGRNLIRKIAAHYPEAKIIVTGCYAQLKPHEVAQLPGVTLVLGTDEKLRISEFIEEIKENKVFEKINVKKASASEKFHPSCERGDRTRFFMKIQDGCDYYCTYCTIPYARGRSRSGSIEKIVEMAEEVATSGGKEIVITGVNIGEFGKDNGQSFFELLKRLDGIEGIERYRISSIEPNLLTKEMVEWISREARAFMPHFHIPLQSGSDRVLKLMNRRYDTSLFADKISMIREYLPEAFIGVDIIAGARGETEEEWQKTIDFVEKIDVTRFHVFPYSERPGTPALLLGDAVSPKEKHQRADCLIQISDKKMDAFLNSQKGKIRKVLWESISDEGLLYGLTDNYIRIEAMAPVNTELINKVSKVKIENIHPRFGEMMTGLHIN